MPVSTSLPSAIASSQKLHEVVVTNLQRCWHKIYDAIRAAWCYPLGRGRTFTNHYDSPYLS